MSKKPVRVTKRMIVAHITDSRAHIFATEAALLETDPEIIGTVHYKQLLESDSNMTRHKDV